MSLGYRPIVYMWIAQYNDGQALPQFNPETGEENLFKEVDHSRLVKFGFYPFSEKMAKLIYGFNGLVVIPSFNPSYEIDVGKGQELFARRRNMIKIQTGERWIVYHLGVDGNVIKIKEDGTIEN